MNKLIRFMTGGALENAPDREQKYKWERIALWAALLLPIAIMLGIFIANRIYPFGNRSFLASDMYHQYMPFFSELMRKIRAGESLSYSYNVGIGSNFYALFVYYLASPLYWIAFLVPQALQVEFLSYMVVLRIGLAGFTSYLYLRKHFVGSDWKAILFSVFYAFSGYMAAYDFNIMWLDCVVLLPLILLGLELLVKEGKCTLYCISLALCIFTNFYISIMVCIFIPMYFLLLIIGRKIDFRAIGNFILYSLLAGGMAAALLIPVVCALLETDFGDMNFPDKVESYFSILDMMARHSVCVSCERGLQHWPNIYCGSAVIMLVPMYLLNKKISIREKMLRMVMIGFLLISFSTNILDFIWHGLNYPDSFPARQSFIYIFLVLTICYDAFVNLKDAPKEHILYGFLVAVAFFLYCEKFVEHEDFVQGVKLLTLVFCLGYAILLWLYLARKEANFRMLLAVLAVALVIAESSANMAATRAGTVSRDAYLGQIKDYKALYEKTLEREEGEEIYRLEKFNRKTKNDSTLVGFPSASVFSSTMNSRVMDMYKLLGMRYSKVYYSFDGWTPLSAAMLNVKYMYGNSDKYENEWFKLLGKSGDVYLYECTNTLPFGYVAPSGFDLPEGIGNHGIRMQSTMVENLGIEGKLFAKAERTLADNDVLFTAPKDGFYYAIVTSVDSKHIKLTGGALNEEEYKDIKSGALLYLGYLAEDEEIRLTNANDKDTTPEIKADIYRMDETVLRKTLNLLSEQSMVTEEWDSDYLRGKIQMKAPGRLVLSVPYEDGWRIKVNGEETQPEIFGGALIAFDLEEGDYEIEMKYVPEGKWAGIIVSLCSALAFAGLMIWKRRGGNDEQ